MKLIRIAVGADMMDVSEQRAYEMVRVGIIPPGVAVRLGRQVRFAEDELRQWIAAGGQALPGGWRREAE